MRKLAILGLAVVAAGVANAQVSYDSITSGSFSSSGSSPRTSFADDFTTGVTGGLLDKVDFGMVFNSAATNYTFRAQIKFYSSWNSSVTGATSVVGPSLGGFYTDITSGLGSGAWLISVGGLQSFNINLNANTQYAWSMEFFDAGTFNRVASDRCTPLFNTLASAVGSNADVNYVRDGAGATLDGIYTGTEVRSIGATFNMAGRFTTVPEPASMMALGLGIAAMVAKRRKK